jgi:predicted CoA-binding protein
MDTLVIGASENQSRYSYKAVTQLTANGHKVYALGLKKGEINGVEIVTGFPKISDIDTVTLYVGPQNQPAYYDYILALKPRRVIFNPGTENEEFIKLLSEQGIFCEVACTLVLLATQSY